MKRMHRLISNVTNYALRYAYLRGLTRWEADETKGKWNCLISVCTPNIYRKFYFPTGKRWHNIEICSCRQRFRQNLDQWKFWMKRMSKGCRIFGNFDSFLFFLTYNCFFFKCLPLLALGLGIYFSIWENCRGYKEGH